MKKIILITLTVVLSISNLLAQNKIDDDNKTIYFGTRIGSNLYNIKANNDLTSETGLYGGLFIERRLSDKWSLQFEANYAGLSILQFPLLLKYRITDKFELFGGAQLDFSFEQKNMDEAFRNKRFGASLVIGAQYNINSKWFIEGRYIHGLSNQIPIFQGFDMESLYGKKRSFNLGIGYKF